VLGLWGLWGLWRWREDEVTTGSALLMAADPAHHRLARFQWTNKEAEKSMRAKRNLQKGGDCYLRINFSGSSTRVRLLVSRKQDLFFSLFICSIGRNCLRKVEKINLSISKVLMMKGTEKRNKTLNYGRRQTLASSLFHIHRTEPPNSD
jgi:hypothetical protein